jgi:hypothetical protein
VLDAAPPVARAAADALAAGWLERRD